MTDARFALYKPGTSRFTSITYETATTAPLCGTSSDLTLEVTSLDSVRQVVEAWIKANPSRGGSAPTEIADTDWETRLFTAFPLPDYSVAFWEWKNPLMGKPLAIEGDLSAEGMRFAVVVARWNAVITDRLLQGSLVYTEVSRGIGQSQQETGIPHAFGVLTCESLEQALDRAGLKAGNKGFEAACAAMEMVSLHRKIDRRNLESECLAFCSSKSGAAVQQ